MTCARLIASSALPSGKRPRYICATVPHQPLRNNRNHNHDQRTRNTDPRRLKRIPHPRRQPKPAAHAAPSPTQTGPVPRTPSRLRSHLSRFFPPSAPLVLGRICPRSRTAQCRSIGTLHIKITVLNYSCVNEQSHRSARLLDQVSQSDFARMVHRPLRRHRHSCEQTSIHGIAPVRRNMYLRAGRRDDDALPKIEDHATPYAEAR